jgi:hypothetical protein
MNAKALKHFLYTRTNEEIIRQAEHVLGTDKLRLKITEAIAVLREQSLKEGGAE